MTALRRILLVGFVVGALFAVACASGLHRRAQHSADAAHKASAVPKLPLLDAQTAALLAGADRVETFRLADFQDETHTPEEGKAIERQGQIYQYAVLRKGLPQGQAFASKLASALSGLDRSDYSQCFDPGVGFRVWNGKKHADIFVCFYCSGVQAVAYDETGKIVRDVRTGLDASRPALLALSRAAFPNDKALEQLKS